MITQHELKELVTYNPTTGEFFWNKVRRGVAKGKRAGSKGHMRGYERIMINRKNYYSQRLAWLYVNGELPKYDTDHINGITDDNRISNLRAVTHSENLLNSKRGPQRDLPPNSLRSLGSHGRPTSESTRITLGYKKIVVGLLIGLTLGLTSCFSSSYISTKSTHRSSDIQMVYSIDSNGGLTTSMISVKR